MDGAEPLRIICGPTGAGKSALAFALARAHAVTIVSADSRQIYRGFDIGTAKPSKREQRQLPHRGIDVVAPTERYSAAKWAESVRTWIDVAIAADCDGVHLAGASVGALDARALLQSTANQRARVLTAAVHDVSQIRAVAGSVAAMVLSPFAAVPGKGPALGIAGFAAAVATAPAKHFVALGGILTPEVARDAALAGASAIAVRRAMLDSDPVARCRVLLDGFSSSRRT